MKKIDGIKIAEKEKKDLAQNVFLSSEQGYRRPNLAIILAGSREDSKLYVKLKEKTAKEVGIDTSLYLISEQEDDQDLIEMIEFLNQDQEIDGILIQLPLPAKFNSQKILEKINPKKDVDGFCQNGKKYFSSPVIMAIKKSLEVGEKTSKEKLENKKVFLFYNSEIFKKEVEKNIKEMNLKFDSINKNKLKKILNSQEEKEKERLYKKVKENDILITAMGEPGLIDECFLKDKMILIDVGITKIDSKVWGDFKREALKEKEGFYTPVPGGIGPLTIVCLLKNTWQSFKNKNEL